MTTEARERAPEPEPLWSIGETARFLSVPVATLYRWRHLGKGPYAYRLGRHLRYDPAEVRRWLAAGADHDVEHRPR